MAIRNYIVDQKTTELNLLFHKKTTDLVLLFHKKTTDLVLLWPNMNQKSIKVLIDNIKLDIREIVVVRHCSIVY